MSDKVAKAFEEFLRTRRDHRDGLSARQQLWTAFEAGAQFTLDEIREQTGLSQPNPETPKLTIEPRYCDCTSFCMRQSKNIDPRLCKAARAGLETSLTSGTALAQVSETAEAGHSSQETPAAPCNIGSPASGRRCQLPAGHDGEHRHEDQMTICSWPAANRT